MSDRPWAVDATGGSAERNPGSWTSAFSLLFIDHPAPTGLSVSVSPPATQEQNSLQFVAALKIISARHGLGIARAGDDAGTGPVRPGKRSAATNGLIFGGESCQDKLVAFSPLPPLRVPS